jgi:Transcriptional repressor NrdR-like, N-terminal domain
MDPENQRGGAGLMRCAHCDAEDNYVREPRDAGELIRRWRVCRKCGRRFSTFEVLVAPGGDEELRAKQLREAAHLARPVAGLLASPAA